MPKRSLSFTAPLTESGRAWAQSIVAEAGKATHVTRELEYLGARVSVTVPIGEAGQRLTERIVEVLVEEWPDGATKMAAARWPMTEGEE